MKVQPSAPAAPRLAPIQGSGPGYRLSSDELLAGLEVNTLSLASLPPDLVIELIRLRSTWGASSPGSAHTLN